MGVFGVAVELFQERRQSQTSNSNRRTTFDMGEILALTRPDQLKLFKPDPNHFNAPVSEPKTPNEWFVQRYPSAFDMHGSPFLELVEPLDQFSVQVMPVTVNFDFFAAVLGGRRDLGHHVVYFEPEMQWYFKDSDQIFKPTSPEKLQNQYRALMMKCAEAMPGLVHKLNLVHEFRSDKVAKAVVQRAKSVLSADSSFFNATSSHQRVKGQELHERVARLFVDELLTSEPGQILKLNEAYSVFRQMLKLRELPDIKRSDFKAVVGPLIRDEFNVALRNDLDNAGGRGWKGVKMLQSRPG